MRWPFKVMLGLLLLLVAWAGLYKAVDVPQPQTETSGPSPVSAAETRDIPSSTSAAPGSGREGKLFKIEQSTVCAPRRDAGRGSLILAENAVDSNPELFRELVRKRSILPIPEGSLVVVLTEDEAFSYVRLETSDWADVECWLDRDVLGAV